MKLDNGWAYLGDMNVLPPDTTHTEFRIGERKWKHVCPAELQPGSPWIGYGCTRRKGHEPPHQAGDGRVVLAEWT